MDPSILCGSSNFSLLKSPQPIQKCAKLNPLQTKTIHKSVEQLCLNVVQKDDSGAAATKKSSGTGLFDMSAMKTMVMMSDQPNVEQTPRVVNRNSKSEENLLDIAGPLESSFNLHSKQKSSSCEVNNEFKEETDNLLGRALQERLKLKNFNTTFAAEKEISDNQNCEPHKNCENIMMPPLQSQSSGVTTDTNGLIVPKKLINPCLESSDRKNLHRELLFNQKIGKNVLNQRTELQKALQKQKERQFINAQIQNKEQQCSSSELGRVIMQRAQRLEGIQKDTNQDDIKNQLNPEYLNARAKLRATIDSK